MGTGFDMWTSKHHNVADTQDKALTRFNQLCTVHVLQKRERHLLPFLQFTDPFLCVISTNADSDRVEFVR